MQTRENALKEWLKFNINLPDYTLSPLSGDASFRRYFRLHSAEGSYVIMDAPPEQESIKEFLLVANFLKNNGLHAPQIFASNLQDGFIMLEDFGDVQFLAAIKKHKEKLNFYKSAIDDLIKIQCTDYKALNLPSMDREFYQRELSLFKIWFLNGYLKLQCTDAEIDLIDRTFENLIQDLIQIPTTLVHRDYHSRNLMILNESQLGMLDFQDAMVGPVTYDLVSLLKDCYTKLTSEELNQCLEYFYQRSSLRDLKYPIFKRFFDLTGLQRHLKVLGIFSRLYLRDGKENYLKDLPLTLNYVQEVLSQYPEYTAFGDFINNKVSLP